MKKAIDYATTFRRLPREAREALLWLGTDEIVSIGLDEPGALFDLGLVDERDGKVVLTEEGEAVRDEGWSDRATFYLFMFGGTRNSRLRGRAARVRGDYVEVKGWLGWKRLRVPRSSDYVRIPVKSAMQAFLWEAGLAA